MKKLIIFMFSLQLLVGCNQSNAQYNSELSETIYSIVENPNNSEFNLKPLTSFTWDKAELFGPYTGQKEIEGVLGIRYHQTGGIEDREDRYLLVFINDNKAVQYTLLDRQDGVNFSQEKDGISPSYDVIKIIRY